MIDLKHCEGVLGEVFDELRRAEEKFPIWPYNIFEALAILGEEFGELQRAALQYKHEGQPYGNVRKEAVQTAAMALRFLFNLRKDANGESGTE